RFCSGGCVLFLDCGLDQYSAVNDFVSFRGAGVKSEMKSIDISGQKLVAMRDVEGAKAAGASRLVIGDGCVITPSARDFLSQNNIALVTNGNGKSAAPAAQKESSSAPVASAYGGGSNGATQSRSAANSRLFSTPEAEAIKKEICAVGRKLWMRQFVDGNGGNISYRIGPNEVI